MKKGDIVLISFPFTDLTGSKQRPALILTLNYGDVIVAFLSTKIERKGEMDIYLNPDDKNGLKRPSILILEKIATVSTRLVSGKLGELSKDAIYEIDKSLMQIFKINHHIVGVAG